MMSLRTTIPLGVLLDDAGEPASAYVLFEVFCVRGTPNMDGRDTRTWRSRCWLHWGDRARLHVAQSGRAILPDMSVATSHHLDSVRSALQGGEVLQEVFAVARAKGLRWTS